MNLVLRPVKIKLMVLVTLEINFLFFSKTIVLFKANLWSYTSPTIRAKILDMRTAEKDETAPAISEFIEKPGNERVNN